MEIHPQFIEKDGKSEFVILSIEEFTELKNQIAHLKDLREAKSNAEKEAGLSLEQLKDELKK